MLNAYLSKVKISDNDMKICEKILNSIVIIFARRRSNSECWSQGNLPLNSV